MTASPPSPCGWLYLHGVASIVVREERGERTLPTIQQLRLQFLTLSHLSHLSNHSMLRTLSYLKTVSMLRNPSTKAVR